MVRYSKQYAHCRWAHQRLLDSVEAMPTVTEPIARLFRHIFAAEELWHARCTGLDYDHLPVFPSPDSSELRRDYERVTPKLTSLMGSSFDEHHRISFHDTKGNPYSMELGDILTHVLMHGAHHRAQIAQRMRAYGVAPPPLDYIYYCRDHGTRHDE